MKGRSKSKRNLQGFRINSERVKILPRHKQLKFSAELARWHLFELDNRISVPCRLPGPPCTGRPDGPPTERMVLTRNRSVGSVSHVNRGQGCPPPQTGVDSLPFPNSLKTTGSNRSGKSKGESPATANQGEDHHRQAESARSSLHSSPLLRSPPSRNPK